MSKLTFTNMDEGIFVEIFSVFSQKCYIFNDFVFFTKICENQKIAIFANVNFLRFFIL